MERLRQIEEEEAERQRKKRMSELEFGVHAKRVRRLSLSGRKIKTGSNVRTEPILHHTTAMIRQILTDPRLFAEDLADGEVFGITDSELDEQVDALFDEPPIAFIPRKSSAVDMAIHGAAEHYKLTIPIVHIKDKTYLVGTVRNVCDIVDGKLMISHNGITEAFEDYVPAVEKSLQRMLVFEMIKSGESLELVIETLISGHHLRYKSHTGAQWREAARGRSNSPSAAARFAGLYSSPFAPSYDISGRKSAGRVKSPRLRTGAVSPKARARF